MRAILIVALLLCVCGRTWGQTTRLAATRPAGLRPATAATTRPTSRPGEPLSTPESAVLHMFKLMADNDALGVRSVLTDPPPLDDLKRFVAQRAVMMKRGSTIEVMESRIEGNAAAVLYRTIYPEGNAEVAPVFLIGRYERWKVVLGQINPKRYTAAEKGDIVALSHWLRERLPGLAPATQPAQPVPPAQ